ncbi:MAG: hypothetical protein HYX53_11560 [Chloroflexi bacterium]|nr:hypothetical protein [Chloroflexota bacterium]
MVGTIAPLVKVARKQWAISSVLFLVSCTGVAVLGGASLGLLGRLVDIAQPTSLVLIGGVSLCLALVDITPSIARVPSLGWSVPRSWWERFGPNRGAVAYGTVLGLGVSTVVPYASFYLLLFGALLLGPTAGIAIGASYGFARALPVPIASAAILAGADPIEVGDFGVGLSTRFVRLSTAFLLVLLGAMILITPSAIRVPLLGT